MVVNKVSDRHLTNSGLTVSEANNSLIIRIRKSTYYQLIHLVNVGPVQLLEAIQRWSLGDFRLLLENNRIFDVQIIYFNQPPKDTSKSCYSDLSHATPGPSETRFENNVYLRRHSLQICTFRIA